MKITVDRSKCLGSGNCVAWAPAVFDQSDDDYLVVLLADEVPAGQEQTVQQSARLCPAQAITIDEQ